MQVAGGEAGRSTGVRCRWLSSPVARAPRQAAMRCRALESGMCVRAGMCAHRKPENRRSVPCVGHPHPAPAAPSTHRRCSLLRNIGIFEVGCFPRFVVHLGRLAGERPGSKTRIQNAALKTPTKNTAGPWRYRPAKPCPTSPEREFPVLLIPAPKEKPLASKKMHFPFQPKME